jgi:tRNA(His) 5'-end guanylyltransferase
MTDKTALGDRMKRYEHACRHVLPRRTYTIIRVDGKAFHTLLQHAARPFDEFFMECMAQAASAMCEQLAGCQFAYLQSDEISFLLTDFAAHETEPWMGGVIQKMASVAGAMATDEFAGPRSGSGGLWACGGAPALFDARAFTIPDPVEVANYFIWRQRDAVRNSVSMAAQAHFGHESLQGLSSDQMQERLWSEKQVNWNDYPAQAKRGAVVVREAYPVRREEAHMTIPLLIQPEFISETVTRRRWKIQGAPRFKVEAGSFLSRHVPPLPSLPPFEKDGAGFLTTDAIMSVMEDHRDPFWRDPPPFPPGTGIG